MIIAAIVAGYLVVGVLLARIRRKHYVKIVAEGVKGGIYSSQNQAVVIVYLAAFLLWPVFLVWNIIAWLFVGMFLLAVGYKRKSKGDK